MNKYYQSLDICKFIMAIMIIGIHTTPFADTENKSDFMFANVIFRIAVPMFACISSYLFYARDKHDIKQYLKHLGIIYIVWTIIYLPLSYLLNKNTDGFVLRFFQEAIFSGTFTHLWFLPALMSAMAVIYWGGTLLNTYVMFAICLLLYTIGSMGDTYSWLIHGTAALGLQQKYGSIFITTRNGIFFLPFFVMTGKYFAEHNVAGKSIYWLWGCLAAVILFLLEGCMNINRISFDHNFYFMLLSLVPILFKTVISLRCEIPEALSVILRKSSSLIFFSHFLVLYICNFCMRKLGIDYSNNHFLEFAAGVVVSWIFSLLLIRAEQHSKIKFLKFLS